MVSMFVCADMYIFVCEYIYIYRREEKLAAWRTTPTPTENAHSKYMRTFHGLPEQFFFVEKILRLYEYYNINITNINIIYILSRQEEKLEASGGVKKILRLHKYHVR
mmetsp:Transcript_77739/g.209553  ORF Transcript_77739/g.209553 Transcript_77739/m.209553 type:complete len:107 (-) Transcript_77739:60-380(-)